MGVLSTETSRGLPGGAHGVVLLELGLLWFTIKYQMLLSGKKQVHPVPVSARTGLNGWHRQVLKSHDRNL